MSYHNYVEWKQEVRRQLLCKFVLTMYRYPCIFHPSAKCCDYPHEAGEQYVVRVVRSFSKQRCSGRDSRVSGMLISLVGRRDTEQGV